MAPRSRKRRTTSNRPSKAKRTKYEFKKAPGFLDLPTELRLQIYSYLLPDTPTIQPKHSLRVHPEDLVVDPEELGNVDSMRWARRLRQDRSLCDLQIMRVNKLINTETSDMLYNSLAMEIEISETEIRFLRSLAAWKPPQQLLLSQLDNALRRFKKLEVRIGLWPKQMHFWAQERLPLSQQLPWGQFTTPEDRQLKNHINWIADRLTGRYWNASGSLEDITILFTVHNKPAVRALADYMEWLLNPFRNLRNLRHASVLRIELPRSCHAIGLTKRQKEDQKVLAKRIDKMYEGICSEMCTHEPIQEPGPLVSQWQNLHAWLGKTDFKSESPLLDEILHPAWTAYDRGCVEDFAAAVESIEQPFEEYYEH
ncbi:hypothetical protein NA57DRAFT_80828 [Rhizodiscina lignyota]|uniref:Uncharacterized protein n=1 Tax=Rhizodiscina lignyota TaxID=1504668 RepID=A0A9P4I873_9PEZI|nr:hypothetical protein NA57DRAFT_80828 [Rhizodiscina lignyota]